MAGNKGPATILIVEDDPSIRIVLKTTLNAAGFPLTTIAASGDEGLRLAKELRPSLILLDIMLPVMDGITVLKKIREITELNETRIIILTARGDDCDVINGLEQGADDYVTKPFSREVLLARIQAVLRRVNLPVEAVKPNKGLTIDTIAHMVKLNGEILSLTSSEYRILTLLLSRPNRVYTRSQIIDLTQNPDRDVTERAVDVQIVGLRRKLGEWAAHIETVRSVGYRYKP